MPGFTVSAVKGVGVAFSWRPAGGRGFLLARRTSHEVALYWEDLRRASLCRSCEGRSRAGVYRYPSPGWRMDCKHVPSMIRLNVFLLDVTCRSNGAFTEQFSELCKKLFVEQR
ncbi:uncharacterized protein LOC116968711 isoform X7 [Amblyraja radiata]|uniref:uncharacterized protein LOC116968711 isoform X7 n=1 Tax=Amblyraja radiata TaxID=386614 RepID=UPI001402C04B|nr:uncharacterized protein LOC116968711 isoform X7 [Amblyraja radiata]